MKLLTNVPPRQDGTVILEEAGKAYTFAPDERGDLVCDVEGDALIARLLMSGNFEPADEADIDQAEQIMSDHAPQVPTVSVDQVSGDPVGGTGDDLPDDDPVNMSAMPQEANTPAATAAKKKGAGSRR